MLWCLFLVLLGDDPSSPANPLQPRWIVGQESLYRGMVKEVSAGQDIQLQRQYQLEVRLLVLGVKDDKVDLACCTRLTQHNPGPGAAAASSIHLTFCTVDLTGRVLARSPAGGSVLDVSGPATWEIGFLLAPPARRLQAGLRWEVTEPGRLPRRCTVNLPDPRQPGDAWDVRCEQESVDWRQPRADSTAWRRTDRLSYSPKFSLPRQVERLIERRAPAHQQVTTQITTEYELVRQDALEGPMLAERKRDLHELKLFREEYDALAAKVEDGEARAALRRLTKRVSDYYVAPGRTPYRESAVTLVSLVRDAGEGKRIEQPLHQELANPVAEGQFAPDCQWTTTDGSKLTLKQFRGRPCLIAFVTPGTELSKAMIPELAQIHRQFGEQTFTCLLLSMTDRLALLPANTHPSWKVVDGRSEAPVYGVKETPFFVLLNVDGAVLKCLTGWGPETKQTIQKLVGKELAKVRK